MKPRTAQRVVLVLVFLTLLLLAMPLWTRVPQVCATAGLDAIGALAIVQYRRTGRF